MKGEIMVAATAPVADKKRKHDKEQAVGNPR